MHSSTFPGAFSLKFLTYIFVGPLQNINFNIKDSDHFTHVLLV